MLLVLRSTFHPHKNTESRNVNLQEDKNIVTPNQKQTIKKNPRQQQQQQQKKQELGKEKILS